jgi:acyl CoA:acetate/3-ketoacid CoA transferase beta subunit
MNAYNADEMMTVAAARALVGRTACFVGIGLPSMAANLAPRCTTPTCPSSTSRHHRRQAEHAATVHWRR